MKLDDALTTGTLDLEKGRLDVKVVAPQKRIGLPRDVSEVVAFLLSDAASFADGAVWAMDGGALCTIRH
ncbi:SDR family oxidoreductase [Sorangium sp. So ce726]|uniref:SDR family oxidoreductase n=1 Tax=Sorangium sp. So ce726 TaxID=3133319 RepID=UPI003F6222F9